MFCKFSLLDIMNETPGNQFVFFYLTTVNINAKLALYPPNLLREITLP